MTLLIRTDECTGLGKVPLASRSSEDCERAVEQIERGFLTPNSIADPESLWHELDELAQGWDFDDCEPDGDACCVAAPVRDGTGATIAAVNVSSLASRMTDDPGEQYREVVMLIAAGLSALLGYVPAPPASHLSGARG